MSSRQIRALRSRLTFKLTVLYAVIFILSSFLALTVFYLRISSITHDRTDTELSEDLSEMRNFGNLADLRAEIETEMESASNSRLFFRLYSPQGELIAAWNAQDLVPANADHLLKVARGQDRPQLETIDSIDGKRKYRAATMPTVSALIVQMGLSLEESEQYLSVFQHLIGWLIVPICLLAALIGWLVSRKALQGVGEVTRTAMDISKGAFDRRVEVRNHSTEIDELAHVFNGMVDRLHEMIRSTRDMSDNIAHDLRSPLSRIRAEAEMMLMGSKSSADHTATAVSIIEECDQLISIINTMLDITEAEAGTAEIKSEALTLSCIVEEAIDIFRHIAEMKSVFIITDIEDQCSVIGNKSRLQRLTTNLLENAIKYNRPGGHVTITVQRNHHRANMIFKDDGIGISPQDLPRIFNRFYRCDRSRSSNGIGLGLSLAKAIAEASGGNISVASTPGEGSTFTVILPLYGMSG